MTTDRLLLWFQLVVSVKRHRAATHSRPRSLFMLFQPDMFDYNHDSCISLNSIPELPAPNETLQAVSRANLGSDNKSMFQLHMCLQEHSQVVMPKSTPPLILATEKSRRLLRSFKSLSEATSLSVYLPLGDDNVQSLRAICNSLLARQLVNHAIDFESTYKGGAERDVWSNFDIFPTFASQHESPKVDGLAATKPPATTAATLPKIPVLDFEATEAILAGDEESKERVLEETVPPPQYIEHDAKKSNLSPLPAAASRPGYQPGQIDHDGEKTEDDKSVDDEQQEKQHTSPRYSPPRKKRKIDDDDDDDDDANRKGNPAIAAAEEPTRPTTPPSAYPPPSPPPPPPPAPATATALPRPRNTTTSTKQPHHHHVHFSTAPLPNEQTSKETISSHAPHTISPDVLRTQLARFLRWLAAVDIELEHRLDDELWRLGEAAAAGDGVAFYRLQARCKAGVLVGYRRS
ncbi:hypothetical protein SLS55_004988 [Diplodia seriata]|uniref:Uncharacterized protein n=1 Tax=Diplodia seriata TaxID=420778 RepID=A0ABR3CNP2_9PEZI